VDRICLLHGVGENPNKVKEPNTKNMSQEPGCMKIRLLVLTKKETSIRSSGNLFSKPLDVSYTMKTVKETRFLVDRELFGVEIALMLGGED